ncbi:MAG: IS1634 family transposase [Bacillota bacterium]
MERLLFAMVASRALDPSSKLGMEYWVAGEVLIDGLSEVEVHQLYRAMDFLLEAAEEIQFGVFSAVADLFNLEVDLIFLDTTSTFFEIEGEDEGEEGLRKWGFGKDKRSDLAQVVVGFAVTRTGIPVRSWVWPGNTADESVIEEVKKDLNGWRLGRVVVVADTGFNSEENRRILQGAGGHYTATARPAGASWSCGTPRRPRGTAESARTSWPRPSAGWKSLSNWTGSPTGKRPAGREPTRPTAATSARPRPASSGWTRRRSAEKSASTASS